MIPAGRLGSRAGERKRWIITAFRTLHRPAGRPVGRRRRLRAGKRTVRVYARVTAARSVAWGHRYIYYWCRIAMDWSRGPQRRRIRVSLLISGLLAVRNCRLGIVLEYTRNVPEASYLQTIRSIFRRFPSIAKIFKAEKKSWKNVL